SSSFISDAAAATGKSAIEESAIDNSAVGKTSLLSHQEQMQAGSAIFAATPQVHHDSDSFTGKTWKTPQNLIANPHPEPGSFNLPVFPPITLKVVRSSDFPGPAAGTLAQPSTQPPATGTEASVDGSPDAMPEAVTFDAALLSPKVVSAIGDG